MLEQTFKERFSHCRFLNVLLIVESWKKKVLNSPRLFNQSVCRSVKDMYCQKGLSFRWGPIPPSTSGRQMSPWWRWGNLATLIAWPFLINKDLLLIRLTAREAFCDCLHRENLNSYMYWNDCEIAEVGFQMEQFCIYLCICFGSIFFFVSVQCSVGTLQM